MPSTYKYFCPKCKRTFKSYNHCTFCNIETICLGKKWRFPKHNASKSIWKKELSKLKWFEFNKNLMKLYFDMNLPFFIKKDKENFQLLKKEKIDKQLILEGYDYFVLFKSKKQLNNFKKNKKFIH